MLTFHLSNRRGIALLLALGVITILLTTAMEFYRQVRSSLMIAGAARDRALVQEMAASGIHLAMALLIKDRKETETDNLAEEWADKELLKGAVADLAFEQGELEIDIEDELGRIQVNALVKPPRGGEFNPKQVPLWERYIDRLVNDLRMLEVEPPLEFPEETATNTIINAMKDWLDSGDDDATTGLTGAENDYYAELEPPYTAANAAMVALGELLLVKGIAPELYHGHGEVEGMVDGLTVFGLDSRQADLTYKGKININTARLAVLRALLPEEFSDLADAIDALRRPDENGETAVNLESPNWFQEVPGAGGVTIDPELITFQSDTFRVRAAARIEKLRGAVTAIVQRYQDTESGQFRCRILQWMNS